MRVSVHTYQCIHTLHTHMHTYVYKHKCICTYICIYIYLLIHCKKYCIYIYVFIHASTTAWLRLRVFDCVSGVPKPQQSYSWRTDFWPSNGQYFVVSALGSVLGLAKTKSPPGLPRVWFLPVTIRQRTRRLLGSERLSIQDPSSCLRIVTKKRLLDPHPAFGCNKGTCS